MFSKSIAAGHLLLPVLFVSGALFSQSAPVRPNTSAGLEFPVTMRQKVVAGASPVGTKVEARLEVATLVNGVVVPQDAILSGEVIESVAKSGSEPSRLAIRLDSARWKNRSAPVVLQFTKKAYLTAWYYPALTPPPRDLSEPPADTGPLYSRRRDARSNYPAPDAPASIPFPGRDINRSADTLPPPSASGISNHRVLMKNMESTHNAEGALTLTSKRFDIKLDKTTTYVFAAGDLARGPG